MRIWHDGAAVSTAELSGVNAAVWLLAREQARLGHEVALLLADEPGPGIRERAADCGIRVLHVAASTWGYHSGQLDTVMDECPPDLVHMHSVFIPRQASFSDELKGREIPYVVSPHGGFSPTILHRNALAKQVYRRLFEARRCAGAAAILVAPGEADEVRQFLEDDHARIEEMPVPIDVSDFAPHAWRGNLSARRFVFLGRFDVHVKGLDRLVDLAGLMRDFEFHLYGKVDPKTSDQLEQLQNNIVPNVFFHPPVFGADKIRTLCEASMYLQLSRSESFGIAIAEAMSLGVPCAISDEIHMADAFRAGNLGLTLPAEMGLAARMLTDAAGDERLVRGWSARARRHATLQFDAPNAARRHLELYRRFVPDRLPDVFSKTFKIRIDGDRPKFSATKPAPAPAGASKLYIR